MNKLIKSKPFTTNEAVGVQFFKIATPKKSPWPHSFSSASLYRRTQTSTPCAILENSRDSTFFSRYSSSSKGNATVNDFLRDVLDIGSKCFKLIINNLKHIASISCNLHEGVATHEAKQTTSERAESREERQNLGKCVSWNRKPSNTGRIRGSILSGLCNRSRPVQGTLQRQNDPRRLVGHNLGQAFPEGGF